MVKKTIMLVEDDPDIVTVLRGNLSLAGFAVATAGSAEEAVQLLVGEAPDLLILDLGLPDYDGLLLCQKIKAAGHEFPIIMLTARDSVADKVLGFECGADDYLVKPFAFLELEARIKACLRRREKYAEPKPERLCFGELKIDHAARRVWLGNREISLTRIEFDLLYLLAMHVGETLSRDDLKHALWDKKSLYSWSRTIDVHIQHLRQKIERNPEAPELIVTITGVGYRLDVAAS